ncbi:Hypothetical protein NTJ_05255 [Nesidiocoris tenuis]|uniref:Uncharacterized protein n=1 Tax=Nesidiocoris tenuis TaxID=355587 RepID=A0ABN7AMH5_9HEMI|nr:Hypothetical protein NTJ_05255 [Nesidiocoris tenuis]
MFAGNQSAALAAFLQKRRKTRKRKRPYLYLAHSQYRGYNHSYIALCFTRGPAFFSRRIFFPFREKSALFRRRSHGSSSQRYIVAFVTIDATKGYVPGPALFHSFSVTPAPGALPGLAFFCSVSGSGSAGLRHRGNIFHRENGWKSGKGYGPVEICLLALL